MFSGAQEVGLAWKKLTEKIPGATNPGISSNVFSETSDIIVLFLYEVTWGKILQKVLRFYIFLYEMRLTSGGSK